MASIEDCVKEIISDNLSLDADEVKLTSTFEDLGADSLDQVELVMQFEEAFDLEIPDDSAHNITTVQEAVNYIQRAAVKK